jgi:hypothetical protein
VNGLLQNAWRRMIDTRLVRRVSDALLHARCRRHLADLDRLQPERCQARMLLGLVHRARSTPFGREHDFSRIRTPDDFRRLVPLRTPEESDGMAFPDATRALNGAHRAAHLTALASVLRVRPQTTFCAGAVAFLGEATSGTPQSPWQVPRLLRPYAIHEPMLADVARLTARSAATCLAGSLSGLLKLIAEVKRHTRLDRVAEVWPNLAATLWTRQPSDPSAALLREEVGEGVVMLEMVSRFGSPIGTEDPETGLLRWLPNHGVYCEFIPAAQAHQVQPERWTFDGVEAGADYELVVTSPVGLWACRTGEIVRFERRDVPLFRFTGERVEIIKPAPVAIPTAEVSVGHHPPTQAPHRRSAGIPATPPGMFVHSPWSAHADRG